MTDGSHRPRRTYSSSEQAARRAHAGKAGPDGVAAASEHEVTDTSAGHRRTRGRFGRTAAAGAATEEGAHASGRGRRRRRGCLGCFGRLLGLLLLLGLIGCIGLFVVYQRTDLPNPNAIASAQVNVVYFDDGRTEIGRISSGANRESVELKQVPEPVQRAFLAAEDRTFYQNKGISPTGIARAVWVGVTGGETQGGSTITQQYVKNYFLTSDQTYTRKLKEMFLSVKLDQEKSKEEILRDYLNTIYFGRGAYGIQTASKAYFDKDVSELTAAEGAVLASIVRGPNFYDPSVSAENKKRNTERASWILDSMVELGWLPTAERAAMTIPRVVPKKPPAVTGGTNGYLVAAAKAELVAKAKLTEADFERGGLRIVTTIDEEQQAKAVEAVQRYWPEGKEGLHIGLAAVKPGHGGITAMYGGPDFARFQFNDATQRTIPAASTFKVFTLAAALEKGVATRSTVSGDMPYRPPGAEKGIDNAEGEGDMGLITLKEALAHSVNTAFARLNWALDPKYTAEMATRLGVPVPEPERNIIGNTLGQTVASPVQMAGAYATFAAKGRYVAPHIIDTAKTANGSVDYTADTEAKQVVSEEVSADVVDAMRSVITNGTATRSVAGRLTRPAAGKTGTGEDSTSAWFDGFVPQLAAAVSMSQIDEKNSLQRLTLNGSPVYGGGLPTKIWARFMRDAMRGQEVQELPERSRIGKNRRIGSKPELGMLLTEGGDAPYIPQRRRTSTATPSESSTGRDRSTRTSEPSPSESSPSTDRTSTGRSGGSDPTPTATTTATATDPTARATTTSPSAPTATRTAAPTSTTPRTPAGRGGGTPPGHGGTPPGHG